MTFIGKAGNARDWVGRPTEKKRPDRDEYNCSRYDLGNQHFDDYCTTHLIRTAVVNELLLEAIKEVCDYAQNNEAEFMAQVYSASEDRQAKAAKAHSSNLSSHIQKSVIYFFEKLLYLM